MSEPNPAPWTYENRQDHCDRSAYGVVLDADGKVLFDTLNSDVAEIHTDHGEGSVTRTDERGRVNLTLAAAAPDLLAAAQGVLDWMTRHREVTIAPADFGIWLALRDAVALAKGERP